MPTEKRLFTRTQKRAILERQGGSCAGCGLTLKRFFWDGDHKTRWIDGGKTELENGQALCKTCHLAKTKKENQLSNTQLSPRGWQANALERIILKIEEGKKKSHITVTPGGGKTIFSGFIAKHLKNQYGRVFFVIAVPQTALKKSFSDSYEAFGYRLAYLEELDFEGGLPDDFDGAVVSYMQLERLFYKLNMWRNHTSFFCYMVYDEIHHAKEESHATWGENVNRINKLSDFSLTMSGTPFRSDGFPIALLEYDENDEVISDYSYSYKEAVADFNCRAVEFISGNSAISYTIVREGQRTEETLELSKIKIESPVGQYEHSNALRVLCKKENLDNWFVPQFSLAHGQLMQLRKEEEGKYGAKSKLLPPPGGLIVCPPGFDGDANDERRFIKQIAKVVEREIGQPPVVILSDDEDAHKKLEAFKKGRDPWIIAIRMISEGIDIPRLRVGVLAHSTNSLMLFTQLVARILRNLTDRALGQPLQLASWYIPAFPHLLEWGKNIESQAKEALREEKERQTKEAGVREEKEPAVFIAGGATHKLDHVVTGGKQESFDDPYVVRAQAMRRFADSLANVRLTDITEALRMSENIKPDAVSNNDFEGHDSMREQIAHYRSEIGNLVRRLAYAQNPQNPQYSWAWMRVYDSFAYKMPKLAKGTGLLNSLLANYKIKQFQEILEYLQEVLLEYKK